MPAKLLKSVRLTAAQRKAVTYTGPSLLVLAGAGAGKTRVLTVRFAWLVKAQKIKPHNVLALTFTNDAAAEMRRRVGDYLGINPDSLWVGTFHSVCARILRDNAPYTGLGEDFTILDEDDQRRLIAKVIHELEFDLKQYPVGAMAEAINAWKDDGLNPDAVADLAPETAVPAAPLIYAAYENYLAAMGALDFGDLILKVLELFANNPVIRSRYHARFKALLVDEYQDTNTVQVALIKALRGPDTLLTAVGDDDQSIYGWRGAKVNFILNFEQDFADAVAMRLSDNHRSSKAITTLATDFVRTIETRRKKQLRPARHVPDGTPVEWHQLHTAEDEAAFVVAQIQQALKDGRQPSDIAVLARADWLLQPIEAALATAGIACRVTASSRFMDRPEVLDMLAWLKLAHDPKNDAALLRILRQPHWGFASGVQQNLESTRARGCLLAAARKLAKSPQLPPATRDRLTKLVKLADALHKRRSKAMPAELVAEALAKSGYKDYLTGLGTSQARTQLDTLERLMDEVLPTFTSLKALFEQLYFVNFAMAEEGGPAVQLMTGHAAKGLEFPLVFLIGWDKGLMPHAKANETEERRLAYVMLTRGREQVFITSANRRGQKWFRPSPFLALLAATPAAENGAFALIQG